MKEIQKLWRYKMGHVPSINFKIREGNEWVETNSHEMFKDKKVIIFSLPGAFTPTCSTQQLPGYEDMFEQFQEKGIDEIYCISVNDSFVMNAWAQAHNIKKVKMIPDGSGEFTRQMGYLVDKDNLGFGKRSWRYAALIDNINWIETWAEDGKMDNCPTDPYDKSKPENVLEQL